MKVFPTFILALHYFFCSYSNAMLLLLYKCFFNITKRNLQDWFLPVNKHS